MTPPPTAATSPGRGPDEWAVLIGSEAVEWVVQSWAVLVEITAALLVVWALVLLVLWRLVPSRNRVRETARRQAEVAGALRRVSRDPAVPVRVRIRLGLVVAYLNSSLRVAPHFIPIVGGADETLAITLAMRQVARAEVIGVWEKYCTPDDRAAVRFISRRCVRSRLESGRR